MTPDERQIHRIVRKALRRYVPPSVDEAVRESFKSLARMTQVPPCPSDDGGKATASSKQPLDKWVSTTTAAVILTENGFKCSRYTVCDTVCKHDLIVKKRRGRGDGYGPILISVRSLYAYMEWRNTPTKEYDDVSPQAIQNRKEGLAKREVTLKARRKNDRKRD
jgi:hypothetical protein